ncbi:hypothetical protein N0V90_005667 [Kalmusia sp. IMI 367209]|nr:hypothetical protein N0V90_005667 [Kalmusia sp. IMI 367209]
MDVNSNATINSVYREKIDGTSIRLLRFSKSHDGGIAGHLKKFALANVPHFYSASYTWGARTYSDTTIKLKTGELPVLKGLLPFLRMVSEHEDFRDDDWWWIDSLSINLADGQEREQQVRIMADIYKKARRTVVWLGEEAERETDCRGAIDFLHYLQSLQPVFSGNGQTTRNHLRSSAMAHHWTSVSNLLARPWWSRVWTLQEMILPREVKLYCGTTSISRGKFKAAMYSIFLCSVGERDMEHDLIPRHIFDAAFNRRRIHQWHIHPQARGMALVAILAYLGNHSASDSRDRIYSVLGLITARDRRLVGNPEYKSPVQHQYARLVRSYYNEYRNLDIICFSHLFNRYSGKNDPGIENAMPSWVPDWRAHTEYVSPVPLMASQSASEHIGNFRPIHSQKWKAMYDAPGPGQRLRDKANVRFHENLQEMWCDGIILDTIDTLGSLEGCEPRCSSFICARDRSLHALLQSTQNPDILKAKPPDPIKLLGAIACSLVLNRQDKYLRFVAPKHYISDFLVLCNACLDEESRPSLNATFFTWFQQNRHMNFATYTLESLISTLTSLSSHTLSDSLPPPTLHPTSPSHRRTAYPPNTAADAESDDADTFLSRFLDTVRKKSRRLMVTAGGHVGMAPCRGRTGDAVVVLFGCSIPLVLRRVGAGEAWVVVGEAYVHGYMNGEAGRLVSWGTRAIHRFRMV